MFHVLIDKIFLINLQLQIFQRENVLQLMNKNLIFIKKITNKNLVVRTIHYKCHRKRKDNGNETIQKTLTKC